MSIFVDGGKPESAEENPLRNDENLQQTQNTLCTHWMPSRLLEVSFLITFTAPASYASPHCFKIKLMYLMLDLFFFSRLDVNVVGEGGPHLVSLELTLTATRRS